MLKFEGIDLFAGAGGVTTGIEQAKFEGYKIARIVAAINHDYNAIESHWKNHPHVKHFVEDIKTFDVNKLPEIISDDFTRTFIWASLECTNFSNAKGGLPRVADSRTLADHLPRYIEKVNPDYILIENVREFMSWGPLDKNGKPVSKDKGKDYIRWIKLIKSFGYEYEYKILNAADFGAYTSRRRLFIIFSKAGMPIAWPEATHNKNGANGLLKWKPVKEVLNLNNKGQSIFERHIPLSENTLRRIYTGCIKYIALGDTSFLAQYNSGSDNHRVISENNPANTITTSNRFSLIQPEFIINYNHSSKCNSIDDASPTLLTHDKLGLIKCQFLDQQYGQSNPITIDRPIGTLTANPKFNLVTVNQWIMDTQYNNVGRSIEEPSPVITANRKNHYLITTESGELVIKINQDDSEYTKLLKRFMAAYGIIDIYMRMLTIDELKLITGFDYDYYLEGTQSERKKFIGNAVPPVLPQKIFEALYIENLKMNKGLEIRRAI